MRRPCVSLKGSSSALRWVYLPPGALTSTFLAQTSIPQQIFDFCSKTVLLLCEPFWIYVKHCVGPFGLASTPPGFVMPPLGVSLPLCYVSWALKRMLQPNYPCPSLQKLSIKIFPAAPLLCFKKLNFWTLCVCLSKWPSSLLNIQWPRLEANQWLRSFLLDPSLLLEVTRIVYINTLNCFIFLSLHLGFL